MGGCPAPAVKAATDELVCVDTPADFSAIRNSQEPGGAVLVAPAAGTRAEVGGIPRPTRTRAHRSAAGLNQQQCFRGQRPTVGVEDGRTSSSEGWRVHPVVMVTQQQINGLRVAFGGRHDDHDRRPGRAAAGTRRPPQ